MVGGDDSGIVLALVIFLFSAFIISCRSARGGRTDNFALSWIGWLELSHGRTVVHIQSTDSFSRGG
jgi:hypothetical protein